MNAENEPPQKPPKKNQEKNIRAKNSQPNQSRRRFGSSQARAHIKSMLVDGESVVQLGRISPAIYWKSIVVFIFAFIMLFVVREFAVILAIVAILMFIHATILKEVILFVLTDKRIFVRYGILQVDVVDIRFSKIESIELERMLPGFMMGYSTVIVAGTGNRVIAIPFIANGIDIRRSYNDLTLGDQE